MSKIKCLPLRPNLNKLTDFLLEVGFKELSDAVPEEMPMGSLVLLCDKASPAFQTVLVIEFENGGDLYVTTEDTPGEWVDDTYIKALFHHYLYKVIT